uniref:Capsid protein n=1 Tax=Gammatorquevirus homidi1 TaxID=3048380 RepID=A0AAU8H4B9_9VIRU
MPFWWTRRRKRWWGRRYKRRYPKRRQRRYRRRPKRRYRKLTSRRRRSRKKVRRKKPALLVKQWQPDSITLCKIKGFQALVWGAQGAQYLSATHHMFDYTRSKYPGGGGFGAQTYTLKFLYDQWLLRNNIWTKTNLNKDLCRYLKCYLTFYRHQEIDFIIWYDRQPPFTIDKFTNMNFHPYMLLQRKHKIVLPSYTTNPRGKPKKTRKIRPPKQMLSKWFFTEQFCKYDLLLISAAAASFKYPRIGCCNENRTMTLYCLNTKLYSETNWGQTFDESSFYKPYSTFSESVIFWSGNIRNPTKYNPAQYIRQQPKDNHGWYYASINKDSGYFTSRVLKAYKTTIGEAGQPTKPLPLVLGRYNPSVDDGKGNVIFLQNIIGGHWHQPTKEDWKIEGIPLWLAFWGYWDYLEQKYTKSIFTANMFVIKSKYIQTTQTELEQEFWAFLDYEWIDGKNQYDSPITYTEQKLWYPTCESQIKTINAICSTGPYVPKLDNQLKSTWELPIHYSFHFKWGGPQVQDQPVDDPTAKGKYPVPDTLKEAIQIINPTKNIAATMFHQWDYRHGCITSTAIKRMQSNLPTDSSLESDSEKEPPHKKRRVTPLLRNPEKKTEKMQKCLLSLCEEDTCQEEETEQNLIQLIQQQKQQQQQLKHNLLTLIKDIKAKQKLLQLQTGVLE